MKELKMTDDSESKQILLNMRQTGEVSRETVLERFGIDPIEEKEKIVKERQFELDSTKNANLAAALAQGKASEELARFDARAQFAMQDEQHRLREQPFEKDIMSENQNVFVDSSELIKTLAIQLSLTPPEQQQAVFEGLSVKAPLTAALVLERFLADMQPPAEEEQQPSELQGPGAGPPTKANKKADQPTSKSNKSKGASSGDPAK